MRSVIKALGALALAFALVLLAGSQRAGAEEGWKNVDPQGHCSTPCTPNGCPCYELPPIIVKG
jgi:hypothetical protein